jgi:heparan-sulfate lyase
LELAEEEGWVSFQYTKKEPRPAFRFGLKKETENQPIRFVSVAAPYKNDIPDIEFKNTSFLKNEIEIELIVNGKLAKVGYKL